VLNAPTGFPESWRGILDGRVRIRAHYDEYGFQPIVVFCQRLLALPQGSEPNANFDIDDTFDAVHGGQHCRSFSAFRYEAKGKCSLVRLGLKNATYARRTHSFSVCSPSVLVRSWPVPSNSSQR
jgi:hypothetical protein